MNDINAQVLKHWTAYLDEPDPTKRREHARAYEAASEQRDHIDHRRRLTYRASYIADRLDQVEEEIKSTRDALHAAQLDPLEFEKARRALSDLAGIIDRAYDLVETLTRL